MFDLVVSRESSGGVHECLFLERMKERRAARRLLLLLVGCMSYVTMMTRHFVWLRGKWRG